jgi:hypothetical protein
MKPAIYKKIVWTKKDGKLSKKFICHCSSKNKG